MVNRRGNFVVEEPVTWIIYLAIVIAVGFAIVRIMNVYGS